MIRKLLLLALVPLLTNIVGSVALAESQSYGPIIHRQSKQIQELKTKIIDLENSVEDLRVAIKRSGLLNSHNNGAQIDDLKEYIGDGAADSILSSNIDDNKADNRFFDNSKVIAPSGPPDKIDYDLALADLKENNFEEAESKFAAFIEKHPNSRLQSNATFWYAETFYRRGMYKDAAIKYLQSYKKYPNGNKTPDALLKLSYSLASLNKNKEACDMLNKLESEFPKRPISSVKRAKEARNKFHCEP